jgi:tetratricopeptide (TPR) repeat protein
MQGRYKLAIDSARRLVKALGPDATKMGEQAELYYLAPWATLLRFGKWDEILAEPMPPTDQVVTSALALEARGFAFANKGDKVRAAEARAALAALTGQDKLAERYQIVPAVPMLQIALATLDGEIARTSGDLNTAIADFAKARDSEEALPYTEPPFWHQPSSHLLGAALLQAGRPKEAAEAYQRSLRYYRLDGWALFGLAQAQDAIGDKAAADATRKEFATAWTLADTKLTTSRF